LQQKVLAVKNDFELKATLFDGRKASTENVKNLGRICADRQRLSMLVCIITDKKCCGMEQ